MSRKVIQDIIMPIVQKLLADQYGGPFSDRDVNIQDKQLLEFLESQLTRMYSLAGEIGGRCSQLESILKELQKTNPDHLREIVERLLNLYIKLRLTGTQTEDRGVLPNPYFGKRKKPTEVVKVV